MFFIFLQEPRFLAQQRPKHALSETRIRVSSIRIGSNSRGRRRRRRRRRLRQLAGTMTLTTSRFHSWPTTSTWRQRRSVVFRSAAVCLLCLLVSICLAPARAGNAGDPPGAKGNYRRSRWQLRAWKKMRPFCSFLDLDLVIRPKKNSTSTSTSTPFPSKSTDWMNSPLVGGGVVPDGETEGGWGKVMLRQL